MLLYKRPLLDAAAQAAMLRQAARLGLLSRERVAALLPQLGPHYQDRSLLYRMGMWLLAAMAASAASSFLSLFLLPLAQHLPWFCLPLLLAGGAWVLLRRRIEAVAEPWRQGWDDYLAIISYLSACTAWAALLYDTLHLRDLAGLALGLVGWAVLGYLAARAYADALITLLGLLTAGAVPIVLALEVNQQLLFFAPALYIPGNLVLAAWARRRGADFGRRAYAHCWATVRGACLLFAFAFGNVYVTTSAYGLLYPGSLPYYHVYFVTTVGLPLAYLVLGLYRRDRLLLWVGLATTVAARLSLLALYPPAHPAVNALVSGTVLTVLGAWAYLRLKRRPLADYSLDEEAYPQAAALAQQLHTQAMGHEATPHDTAADPGFGPGGGGFGGGGASAGY